MDTGSATPGPASPGSVAPDFDAMLAELAQCGMRGVRVVTRLMEHEQVAADIAVAWLPDPAATPNSLAGTIAAGQAIDSFNEVMAQSVPRIESLNRGLDRLSRAVRRAIALQRRLQTGWPRAGSSDNRLAMQKRQVQAGVGEQIRRDADEDAAERLFDDLNERLEDPGLAAELQAFTVEQVVLRICRDIGLAVAACAPLRRPGSRARPAGMRAATARPHPPDSA